MRRPPRDIRLNAPALSLEEALRAAESMTQRSGVPPKPKHRAQTQRRKQTGYSKLKLAK